MTTPYGPVDHQGRPSDPMEPPLRRCKCSHSRLAHNGKSGICWQHPCACQTYRPQSDRSAA